MERTSPGPSWKEGGWKGPHPALLLIGGGMERTSPCSPPGRRGEKGKGTHPEPISTTIFMLL